MHSLKNVEKYSKHDLMFYCIDIMFHAGNSSGYIYIYIYIYVEQ